MANSLFTQFGNQPPNNGLIQIMAQAQDLQKTFDGNPREEVERLLNSGQMSQDQFNKFAQMANQIRAMMPK
jgi:hypothetical protein